MSCKRSLVIIVFSLYEPYLFDITVELSGFGLSPFHIFSLNSKLIPTLRIGTLDGNARRPRAAIMHCVVARKYQEFYLKDQSVSSRIKSEAN